MPDTIKLRRLDTAKGLTPAELESINYNWWSIEQGLNSVGAVTPIPGGGSGGVSPGGTISHHSLLDLTDGDDHIQYLFLNGRTGGQTLKFNDSTVFGIKLVNNSGWSTILGPLNWLASDGITSRLKWLSTGQVTQIPNTSASIGYLLTMPVINHGLGSFSPNTGIRINTDTVSSHTTYSPALVIDSRNVFSTVELGYNGDMFLHRDATAGGSARYSSQGVGLGIGWREGANQQFLIQTNGTGSSDYRTAILNLSTLSSLTPRIFTFPDASGTFLLDTTIGTIAYSFSDSLFSIFDNLTSAKIVQFQCAGLPDGISTFAFPPLAVAGSDTLAALGIAQTFTADQTISYSSGTPLTITNTADAATQIGVFIQNLSTGASAGLRPLFIRRRHSSAATNLEWYLEVGTGNTPQLNIWRAESPDAGGATFTNPASFSWDGSARFGDTANRFLIAATGATTIAPSSGTALTLNNTSGAAAATLLKLIPHATQSVDVFQIRNAADSANLLYFRVDGGGIPNDPIFGTSTVVIWPLDNSGAIGGPSNRFNSGYFGDGILSSTGRIVIDNTTAS